MPHEIDYPRFARAFGANPGVLPDGEVIGSEPSDWESVFAMLHATNWRITADDGESSLPASPDDHPLGDSFAVWPTPGLRVNFFHYREGVFFDIDLREITDQSLADGLAELMRALGQCLGRDVAVMEEGTSGPPVLRYHYNSDLFSWR